MVELTAQIEGLQADGLAVTKAAVLTFLLLMMHPGVLICDCKWA